VAGAENDASFTTEAADTLDKALTAANVEHTIEFYPAAHGFAVPDHEAVYDADASQRHWDAMESFFGAKLG
jgi:carboxymethylenebutenolidase